MSAVVFIGGTVTGLVIGLGLVFVGYVIGTRDDDCCGCCDHDADLLSDQPVECLAPAEVDRQFRGITDRYLR